MMNEKKLNIMKNLRKLSKRELKSVNGGIPSCYFDVVLNQMVCPCNPHLYYDCFGKCIPLDQACTYPEIEL